MTGFIAQYWLEAVFTLIISGVGLCAKVMYRKFHALELGMQAMLRDRIIDQYNKYMEREYIPIYALENVEAMYKEYHALGGNGTITQLYEELLELSKRRKETV